MAPPLEEPPDGHRERHQRPARHPAAFRGPGGGQFQLPDPLLRRLRTPTCAVHRTACQSPHRRAGGQRRRRAAADRHVPRRLVRPGRHQRDRHLDPAVLADLPGPGHVPRTAAARGGLRRRGGIPRPARDRGRRRNLRRRPARRDLPGHHHQLVHPPGTRLAGRRLRPAGRSRRRRAGRGTRPAGTAAAERRRRDRPDLDPGTAGGRRPGCAGAPPHVHRHRARRSAAGGRQLPGRRRDPLGHRIPGRAGTPRPAASARPRRRDRHGRHPGGRGAARPPGGLRTVLLHDRRQPGRAGRGGGHPAFPGEQDKFAGALTSHP